MTTSDAADSDTGGTNRAPGGDNMRLHTCPFCGERSKQPAYHLMECDEK